MKAFPELKNDLILRVAMGNVAERIPVWLMRQAGRYLPEFRAMRIEHQFFDLIKNPELACEVTLQPIRRFSLDAAIIFSDILVIPQAMGMEVQMIPGKGPCFPYPLNNVADIAQLKEQVDVKSELAYVMEAITLTRHKLEGKIPLIGFAGAPWTLMAYMIEGGGSKNFQRAKSWLYKYPNESKQFLDRLTVIIIDFLVEQALAGAQLLQVFDSWAGELSPRQFAEFNMPCLQRIARETKQRLEYICAADGIKTKIPLIIFAKGAHFALEQLASSDYDVIGLDWTMDPAMARRQVGGKPLQGNLDPCALFASHERIRKEVKIMLDSFDQTQPLIANLGHGMLPEHDPNAVDIFLQAIHDYSQPSYW
jgi:uroporphyrinogen decarboxylase